MTEVPAPKRKLHRAMDRLDYYRKHRNTLPIILAIITTLLAVRVFYTFVSSITFNVSKDHVKVYSIEVLPYAQGRTIEDTDGNSHQIYYYNDSMDNLLCNLHDEKSSGSVSI